MNHRDLQIGQVIRSTKFVEFKVISINEKTIIVKIVNLKNHSQLGHIGWYGPWRQYVFFPAGKTIWNDSCLEDVKSIIQLIMDMRK